MFRIMVMKSIARTHSRRVNHKSCIVAYLSMWMWYVNVIIMKSTQNWSSNVFVNLFTFAKLIMPDFQLLVNELLPIAKFSTKGLFDIKSVLGPLMLLLIKLTRYIQAVNKKKGENCRGSWMDVFILIIAMEQFSRLQNLGSTNFSRITRRRNILDADVTHKKNNNPLETYHFFIHAY